jgi:hypothetical protein
VTEAEWLACDDPPAMLQPLRARALVRPGRPWFGWLLAGRPPEWTGPAAADRKLWLFALGCCGRVAGLLARAAVPRARTGEALRDPREALHAAERLLEGDASAGPRPSNLRFHEPVTVSAADHALAAAYYAACDLFNEDRPGAVYAAPSSIEPRGGGRPVAGIRSSFEVRRAVACVAAGPPPPNGSPQWHAAWTKAERDEAALHAGLLRCLYGNPFRAPPRIDPAWRAWNGGTAAKLARGIYADRAFDRSPPLADALEDAGCADAALLGHLRGPGPHVRGCWAVDLLLGKE